MTSTRLPGWCAALRRFAELASSFPDADNVVSTLRSLLVESVGAKWVGAYTWEAIGETWLPRGGTDVATPADLEAARREAGRGLVLQAGDPPRVRLVVQLDADILTEESSVATALLSLLDATLDRLDLKLSAQAARDAADDAERFLREVLHEMPVAMIVRRGPLQRLAFANEAAQEVLSRPLTPGMPRDLPDAAAAGIYRMYNEVLRTGLPQRHSAHRVMIEPPGKPTREGWFDLSIQPVREADGSIDGTAIFAVDVTDLVLARRAAEAAEARYHELLQSLDAIVWEAPAGHDRWSFVSDRAATMLGYPSESWQTPGFWRSILHPEDKARVVSGSGAAKGDHELEYRLIAADGHVVWVHDVVRVQHDAAGRPLSQRGVMVDITARKTAELDRERMQAEMVQVQKLESLGVMAGGIAHDFNNLLTVILGNASLASMRLPDHSPAKNAIDDLVATAQRASDLTRQLLAYSGRGQLATETIDLGAQVREILGLLGASIPKKARLELELDPLVPPVDADSAQVQQVVMNLVTNAAEALGEKSGTVRVQTFMAQVSASEAALLGITAGSWVALSVQDDGEGMDGDTRARVFDPFFTTKAQGRGLGLAAVHGIVRGHKGAIDVRSKPGVGTVFTVYLPASVQRPTVKPQRSGALRSGSGLVLVIDDEAEVRATARAMIEALGYEVVEAEDGKSGLSTYDKYRAKVRAVLLDMTMPVMSGEEVYRALRHKAPTVPVILSTGYSPVDARRRGMMEGLAGFLQKPYTVRQLGDSLARAIEEGPK